MLRGHDSRELTGNVERRLVTNTRARRVLAGEDGARVDSLALSVNKRMDLVESLGRREPLKSRRGGRGREQNYEGTVIVKGDVQALAFDWINGGR